MSKRILVPLLLIVVVPIGLIGWLGLRVAVEDRQVVEQNLRQVVEQRLSDIASRVTQLIQRIERELSGPLTRAGGDVKALTQLRRSHDLVRQVFWVRKDGKLQFPAPGGPLSTAERRFLRRTRAIWQQRAILIRPGNGKGTDRMIARHGRRQVGQGDSIIDLASRKPAGWISWYWAEGLHLLFWQRLASGDVVGVEVDRVALMARLIGELPDTTTGTGRVALHDSRGAPVYQFGSYTARRGERALATIRLAEPLHAWTLLYFGPQTAVKQRLQRRVRLNIAVILGVIVIGLLVLAIYIYREYSREMRLAAQRVSFVTQVSHELKTPLTNIRLYAELLESAIGDQDSRASKRVGVIVSESQRLTRLINNILIFSKQQQSTQRLTPTTIAVDQVVLRTVEQFKPALEAQEIDLTLSLNAAEPIQVDADALEQIVGNLLGNIEKYAAAGKLARIETRQSARETEVRVSDCGPGVPTALRERVFEPFVRGSDKLADGVTGTGIGLSISRELARQHGGDLRLAQTDRGACFVLTLPRQGGEP